MTRLRWAAPLVVAGLFLTTTAPTAAACSCCDARVERTIVGWSESGKSALVHMTDDGACELRVALEVWRMRSPDPVACFDLTRDPDRAVDIVVSVEADGRWSPVFRSRRRRVGPFHLVPGGRLHVTIHPSPSQRVGLLSLSGHNRSPGTGMYPTELYWVSLPEPSI